MRVGRERERRFAACGSRKSIQRGYTILLIIIIIKTSVSITIWIRVWIKGKNSWVYSWRRRRGCGTCLMAKQKPMLSACQSLQQQEGKGGKKEGRNEREREREKRDREAREKRTCLCCYCFHFHISCFCFYLCFHIVIFSLLSLLRWFPSPSFYSFFCSLSSYSSELQLCKLFTVFSFPSPPFPSPRWHFAVASNLWIPFTFEPQLRIRNNLSAQLAGLACRQLWLTKAKGVSRAHKVTYKGRYPI